MLDSDNVTADMTLFFFYFAGFHNTTSGGLRIKRKYHFVIFDEMLRSFFGENTQKTHTATKATKKQLAF